MVAKPSAARLPATKPSATKPSANIPLLLNTVLAGLNTLSARDVARLGTSRRRVRCLDRPRRLDDARIDIAKPRQRARHVVARRRRDRNHECRTRERGARAVSPEDHHRHPL